MIKHKQAIGQRVQRLIFFLAGGAVGFIAPGENVTLVFVLAFAFYLLAEGFSYVVEYIERATPGA